MSRKFMIHAHAENPNSETMQNAWKAIMGVDLRLYLSVLGTSDAKPRWAIAHAHKTEHVDDGIHLIRCSRVAWENSNENLGAAVFLYRVGDMEGIGIHKTRAGLKFWEGERHHCPGLLPGTVPQHLLKSLWRAFFIPKIFYSANLNHASSKDST